MRSAGRIGVVVVTMLALLAAVGGSASAAKPKLSASQKASVRKALRKQVQKNPAVLRRRSFLRRAALVNFKLPVTIRLRNQCAPTTAPNQASCASPTSQASGTALNQTRNPTAIVNLGPSLGQRTVALGGSLAAEVQFKDSFDGGALGNVSIRILPSTKKFLKTSSVPLLWNPDASDPATRSDANFTKATELSTGIPGSSVQQGCGDFANQSAPGTTSAVPAGYNALYHGFTPNGSTYGTNAGLPGYPYYATAGGVTPAGFLPIYPGVDALDQLKNSDLVGNNDHLGPSQSPFPGAPSYATPSSTGGLALADTIFRTNALSLAIASPGTYVDGATGTSSVPGPTGLSNGPSGTQSYITGASGGEANLFGNIPGKSTSIDVTVSLSTAINAIARIMDQDVFQVPLVSGGNYPAAVFNCHQVWLGAVQNYIPGVRLTGSLRIAPAITKDGKLRIAKATVKTDVNNPQRVALSACLYPASAYLDYNDDPSSFGFSNATISGVIPYPTTSGVPAQFTTGGLWPVDSNALPVFANAEKFDPADPTYGDFGGNAPSDTLCNTDAYKLVKDSALYPATIQPYLPADLANGYTTNASGATVTVAGDITVPDLDVDVLIGDQ